MSVYTRGEVIWLLGMDRQQAIDEDAFPQSQLANMSPDEEAGGSHGGAGDSEDVPLLVIARWTDVHRARKRARLPPELLVPLAMRAQGATEEEVAEQLSLSDSTARRRFRAGLAAVLMQLGVTDHNVDVGRTSSVPACIMCGRGERVRLSEVRYRIKGGWRVAQPERQASVCEACLAPEYWHRVISPRLRSAA